MTIHPRILSSADAPPPGFPAAIGESDGRPIVIHSPPRSARLASTAGAPAPARTSPSRRAWALASCLAITSVFGVVGAAHAERRGRAIESVRFDVHLDLGWHSAFGVGFRADIPVVPDGFVDGVHDELAITVGAELFFFSYRRDYCHSHPPEGAHCHDGDGFGLWPLAAAQWNFYLNESWSIFPELGLVLIAWDDGFANHYDDGPDVYLRPFLGFGGRWHFSPSNSLLMRVNWPAGLQVGLTF